MNQNGKNELDELHRLLDPLPCITSLQLAELLRLDRETYKWLVSEEAGRNLGELAYIQWLTGPRLACVEYWYPKTRWIRSSR